FYTTTLSKHSILKPIHTSDSIGGMSDLDDMDDIEMIMQQLQSEQEQAAESSHRHNYIYHEREDAEERFSVIMKCTSVIRQLAYSVTPDALDEYLQMGDHCARDCLDFFTMCVIQLFVPEYLRKPNFNDIQKLYNAHNNIHGFPRMLESIDCMHWEWKNYPKEWHGQFARGDKKYPTIMLEAVASYDLWIWHAFFRVAGANNDLTVLNNSPLFYDLLDGITPVAPFEVIGVIFEKGYYLADDIYPQWSSFVKSFSVANSEKNVLFKRKQENARKDIERAFGVLQGRWHIICQPARAWTINKLCRVMYTCIILHNMILKDQKLPILRIHNPEYAISTLISIRRIHP
ncbi:ALP1-like protein isoform X1, partial [Tanacetum coccineum]